MNYEIEQKLNRKVDDWEFRSLQSTVDQQKHEIRDLNHRIDQLESTQRSHYDILHQLLELLVNKEVDESDYNYNFDLLRIKQQL